MPLSTNSREKVFSSLEFIYDVVQSTAHNRVANCDSRKIFFSLGCRSLSEWIAWSEHCDGTYNLKKRKRITDNLVVGWANKEVVATLTRWKSKKICSRFSCGQWEKGAIATLNPVFSIPRSTWGLTKGTEKTYVPPFAYTQKAFCSSRTAHNLR